MPTDFGKTKRDTVRRQQQKAPVVFGKTRPPGVEPTKHKGKDKGEPHRS